MPAFGYLKITDKLACQAGPVTYGALYPEDLRAARDTPAIEDQQELVFKFPRTQKNGAVRAIVSAIRAGRIASVVWSDGTFDEWRIGTIDDGRGLSGAVDVRCNPLFLDLGERSNTAAGRGWVSDLPSSGVRNFDYTLTQRTALDIWTNFVIPNCPSWVAAGTIDPTVTIPTLAVSRLTPWALALAVRDALRAMDITCELFLRRNGSTNYLLDLVTQVNIGATIPAFHPIASLVTLKRHTDPTLQATRILVRGANTPDGPAGILGRARWRSGTPVGLTVPLTDRNGGGGPIEGTNQWVNAYLLRVKTGRTYLISASNPTTQTVTLPDVSDIAADEDFEFLLTEPNTNTRRVGSADAVTFRAWEISVIAGPVFTVNSDNFQKTIAICDTSGELVDWQVRRASFIGTTTNTGNAINGTMTVTSIAGFAVGDIFSLYLVANGSFLSGMWLIDAIDVPTKKLTFHNRDSGVANYNLNGSFSIRVYRPVVQQHRLVATDGTNPYAARYQVTASDGLTPGILTMAAATISSINQYQNWTAKAWSVSAGGSNVANTNINSSTVTPQQLNVASAAGIVAGNYVEFVPPSPVRNITVDAVGTAAVGDMLEVLLLNGAGELPVYVDHPVYSLPDPTGYGIKVKELTKGKFGVTNLCPNSWLRTWSSQPGPPDKAYAVVGSTYYDRTAAAGDATANDWGIFNSVALGDYAALGLVEQFSTVTLSIGTAGVGTYTVTWEYWNGSAWTALAGVTDGTTSFKTAGVNTLTFTLPGDWVANAVGDSTLRFWIRAKQDGGTITTQPLGTQALINRQMPDGFTKIGTTPLRTLQNTNATFTQYGGKSMRIQGPSFGSIRSPVIRFPWTPQRTNISAVARLYLASFFGADGPSVGLTIRPRNRDGTAGAAFPNSTAIIYSSDSTSGAQKVASGTFISVSLAGLSLLSTDCEYGLYIQLDVTPQGNPYDIYLDTLEVFGFSNVPLGAFEFGDATALHQAGNNDLRNFASPPVFYDIGVRDLERAFPADFSRLKLTPGGTVRAVDLDYGIDTTVRLVRMDRNLLDPLSTKLSLAAILQRLSSVVAAATTPTSAVSVAPPGPAFFIPVAAGAVLPANAEVAVPSGSITTTPLPAVTAGVATNGTIVVVQPPAAAPTAPVIIVVSGVPPTRRRPYKPVFE